MLWRVRTALPDRPGSLAALATGCGDARVNILGLQIFPDVDSVTDELVLRTPPDWGLPQIAQLIEAAGGVSVSASPCTDAALVDQPTRYVQAGRAILAQPASFPEVVAGLFDAEADPIDAGLAPVQDIMELTVGDVDVQVRRTAPFTAVERARGAAMAELVSDVLGWRKSLEDSLPVPGRRLGGGGAPSYVVEDSVVKAVVDNSVVGLASVLPEADEAGVREITVRVDPVWQRRGIGTRLLVEACRLARASGADEIVAITQADNQAVLPMVLSAGLRSRIRMTGDLLMVRARVHEFTRAPAGAGSA